METKPDIAVYGSLLDKSNIEEYFGSEKLSEAYPTTVKGYKRVFNTEVSIRSATGKNRAILNTERSENYRHNVIIIPNVDFESFGQYVTREDGYRFNLIGDDLVDSTNSTRSKENKTLMAAERKESDERIYPHDDYLQTCLESAKQWNDDFYTEFLETTYLMDDSKLSEYINK